MHTPGTAHRAAGITRPRASLHCSAPDRIRGRKKVWPSQVGNRMMTCGMLHVPDQVAALALCCFPTVCPSLAQHTPNDPEMRGAYRPAGHWRVLTAGPLEYGARAGKVAEKPVGLDARCMRCQCAERNEWLCLFAPTRSIGGPTRHGCLIGPLRPTPTRHVIRRAHRLCRDGDAHGGSLPWTVVKDCST